MTLIKIIRRSVRPEPWAEGEKIPWDDPDFSGRMLREHLSQEHDLASRRLAKIDAHVAWIHGSVLHARPSRVLDLACGPGLYTDRLESLGHECLGIDFSPASIEYAVDSAAARASTCRYRLNDVRTADYGSGHDLVMLIFGEFNTFRPEDARRILFKANQALKPGGTLLLEPETFEAVRAEGCSDPSWYSCPAGLFSDRPHICLTEHLWDADRRASTTRYYVLEEGCRLTAHAASAQAYTLEELDQLVASCGFAGPTTYPSLTGGPDPDQQCLFALVARKSA